MLDALPVNEVFETIQGEASFTGTPSVFVRLQGCPIGCPWCDTKHTWHLDPNLKVSAERMLEKQDDSSSFADMTVAELLQLVATYSARHVVITGGEPALYDLREFTGELIRRGYTVQLETSGTHSVRVHSDTFVTVSPKMKMPGGYPVLPDALHRANEVKMPVGKEVDIENLDSLLSSFKSPHPTVWLQPISQNAKATELCLRTAIERNWKISLQVHKFLGVR